MVAALVGALNTRHACDGIIEATCERAAGGGTRRARAGLHLLTIGVVLGVRLRLGDRVGHRDRTGAPHTAPSPRSDRL